jgi:hypothetical protein
MAKGTGLLIAVGEKPKGKEMPLEEDDSEGGASPDDQAAKTRLAQQYHEAASSGDYEGAGKALEKFIHLCSEY